jgi:NAD(P)-dependent dehydrogenase (short-subunit alcohol dehydrogenase family)
MRPRARAARRPEGRQVSADGHEMHFAVNYLSHYLLTRTLLPLLLQAPSARQRLRQLSDMLIGAS